MRSHIPGILCVTGPKEEIVSISAFLAAKYVSGLVGLNVLIVHRAPPNLGLPESMYCPVVAAEAGQVDRQAGHLDSV